MTLANILFVLILVSGLATLVILFVGVLSSTPPARAACTLMM